MGGTMVNPTCSPGLLIEQPCVQVRETLGEIGRGQPDIDACARIRPGIDQELAGGDVSVARCKMQGTVAVRVGGFDARAACDQKPQKVHVAVLRGVVQRRPAVGVPCIDACARVEEQACDVQVSVANGDLERGAAVAVVGVRVGTGFEELAGGREVVQPHRPEEIIRPRRLRTRTKRRREHRGTRNRGA